MKQQQEDQDTPSTPPAWKRLSRSLRNTSKNVKQSFESVAKSVGFTSVGSMNITMSQANYRSGDSIKGALNLELEEEMQALKLVVVLEAKRRMDRSDAEGLPVFTTMYRQRVVLDGEKSYKEGPSKYKFVLDIPTGSIGPLPDLTECNLVGSVTKAMALSDVSADEYANQVQWSVSAFLAARMHVGVQTTIPVVVFATL